MRRSTKRLLKVVGFSGTLALALAATGQYSSRLNSAEIMRALRMAPSEVGAVAFDPWSRRVTLQRLAFTRSGVRITVGSLDVAVPGLASLALVGPAAAAVATVTAHDIRIQTADSILSIPRIEAHDTRLNAIDLARLFDPESPKPLAERLAKLSVGSVLVPEITMTPGTPKPENKDESVSLHGLAITDVVDGKLGSLTISGVDSLIDQTAKSPPSFSVGRIAASGVDLPLAASIVEGTRSDASAPLRPVYDSISIASIKAGQSATDRFEIGAIQSGALQGRPLTMGLKQAVALLSKQKAELTDADRSQQAAAVADGIRSFSLGRFEVRDFAYAKTDGDNPTSFKLGRLLVDGFASFRSRTIAAEHFQLADKDVRLSFSRSALDGIDGSGLVDLVSIAKGPTDFAPTPDQIRTLAPKLAAASLLDLDIEVPVTDATGNMDSGTLTVFKVPVAEMRIGGFVGNLASDVSSHMEALYDVASPAPGSSLEALTKAGFGRLDMSTDYAATWSESTQEFKLGQFSLAAKDLASISLGGLVSNMSADLMSTDKAAAQRAAQDLRFRTLTVALVNSGLVEKSLPLAAASMNLSIPDLKTTLTSQAHDVIGQVFGPGSNADQLSAAVANFIDQPKSLNVSIRARDGITVGAIQAADNPQDLLKQLDVTAVANH